MHANGCGVGSFSTPSVYLGMSVLCLGPSGEAGRYLGSVQERVRPGFSDEATSWRSGEPSSQLCYLFHNFRTVRNNQLNSRYNKPGLNKKRVPCLSVDL